MMLNYLPDMIIQSTIPIVKFFDNCVYKSPMMELAQVI